MTDQYPAGPLEAPCVAECAWPIASNAITANGSEPQLAPHRPATVSILSVVIGDSWSCLSQLQIRIRYFLTMAFPAHRTVHDTRRTARPKAGASAHHPPAGAGFGSYGVGVVLHAPEGKLAPGALRSYVAVTCSSCQ